MELKKGFLVVFDGIDGAGKTTQANLLFDRLKKRRFNVILSKEPTDSMYGQKIKKLAQGERSSVTAIDEYNLFINDRRIHVENLIKPALQQKKIVILDRYYFSTMAYQGALGLDYQKIKEENESFAPIPEILFLLNVPPRVGLRRIQKSRNEEPNLFEQEENLTKVKQVFDSFKENYIVPVNGTETIEDIHAIVMNVIDDVIDHYLSKDEQYTLFNNRIKAM
ncbi:MAG: dTMP kinase [Deltaproteobacteria bacterium]|nr:dTMP kinase [Deltaproteobacteria bacterium]